MSDTLTKEEMLTETDGLYLQLIHILQGNPEFEEALVRGELTVGATLAIADSFDKVFDRNRRLANIFLSDREAQKELISFWFARSYAEVQASAAYAKAFRRAFDLGGESSK